MKAFIVYSSYDIIDEKTYVFLYGRLENEQSFVSQFHVVPYFFFKKADKKKIDKYLTKFKTEETKITNFQGQELLKVSHDSQTELNKLAKAIHKLTDLYESDIKPHSRFIIDHNLLGKVNIEGEYISSERIDRVYQNPKISPTQDFIPKLKTLSVDIESDESGNLYCIGIYGEKIKKVFMVTPHKLENVIPCKSQEECLEKFRDEIVKQDSDILTGWNFIGFDLKFLQDLYKKLKIPFNIARNNDNLKLRIESNFFRSSSADLAGRQVIDALSLIKDPFIQEAPSIKNAEFDNYTLGEVSSAILGKTKLIQGKNRHEEITELYESKSPSDHQKLADYNLMDCQLVYEILEKTKMIELAIERSCLTGLQFDKMTASIAAFDSLYIREAHSRNLASPTTSFTEKEEKIKGGFVMEATTGIYHNILVLDFKSLYPSILKTFNIDPSSYLGKEKEKGAIESPNGVYFKNTEGILPKIIHKLHEARELAKKEHRELSSYAIKIIMNSFWGVLASPNCRYFDFDMANSITSFARYIIQLTGKEITSKFKVKIAYGDTDSVFVEANRDKEEANKLGKEIELYIGQFYKDLVKKNYNRESFLDLQFQKQYLAFMMPKVRSKDNEKAAKKRYAGLIEKNGKEELEIVGLEAIRGDWTDAAKNFQKELLMMVFHKKEITKFVKDYIAKLESGKIDSELVYRKSIRKDLKDYTKTTPPHVKAARKLDSLDSNRIEYLITTDGPEPIQKLKHKIDYQHYIDKQIKPIAEQVLTLFNKSFDDLNKSSKQSKLF